LSEARDLGVVLLPGMKDIAIGADRVTFSDADGLSHVVEADNVIVAKGATGNLALAESLAAAGFKVHTVGDCNGVGYIEGAIAGAADVAMAI